MPPSRTGRAPRIVAIVSVLMILGAAKALGVFERIGEPARLATSLVELGGWGYLAFIVAYATLQPFGVPGTAFVVAAPLIWPWPVAFALSMTGTLAASVVGFSFARFVARDWVAPRIPPRFRKYDEALERRAFATVFVLRLIFWMPPLLHAFFGVSKVRGSTHFWASCAGYLLPIFLLSFFGQQLVEAVRNAPLGWWVAALFVSLGVGAILWTRRPRSSEPASTRSP